MATDTPATTHRTFTGTVISTKMAKTIVVRVDRVLVHPKYGKRYRVSHKYPVHAPSGKYTVGQTVSFEECRPISKTIHWRVR